jgi:TonB-dependent starch-binding outer membrane protein SusC
LPLNWQFLNLIYIPKNKSSFMKIRLSQLLKICTLLIFTGLSVTSFAQTSVSGKVTDSKDGSPVAGVTVTVKGTKTAVRTDANGAYTIVAPNASSVLVFSSIGFTAQLATATNGAANVALVQNNTQLQDVVVVAYGTKKKGDLTGAVTSVSAKDFQKGNIASSEQLLQGKVAGLQITSGGGSAGGGSRIRIRGGSSVNGGNDPLIVIDGVPVEGNGIGGNDNLLATINPNDIESMSVLKDASATALFGSRASNGVIIITTKKGVKGKIKYNFNTQISSSSIVKKVDVLTGDEIRNIIIDDNNKTGNLAYVKVLGVANTDWQSLIYQNAIGVDNNLSASGNVGVLPFRASLGYSTQEGIIKTNKFDRLSTAINLSPKFLDDHLTVNLNFKYSNVKANKVDGGVVGAAASFDPTQANNPINKNKFGDNFEWINASGEPINTNGGSVQPNPLSLLDYKHDKAITNRIITNLQLDYKLPFFPDLHAQVNMGIDKTSLTGNYLADSVLVSEYQKTSRGKKSPYEQSKQNTLIDLSLFYTKEIKSIKTKFDVLALHSYQQFVTNEKSFSSNATGKDTLLPGSVPVFATDKPQNALESYVGRINATIDNKYLITASIRSDASSRLSKGNRVKNYPSVALGWKVKEEFFKNSKAISELKLRFGWGITGQQGGIGNYDYLPRYSASSNAGAAYQFGNTFVSYLRPQAYNSELAWETTTTTNFGLDFGFINNRISGSVEVYNKKTKNLLFTKPVAPGANFNPEITANVGNLVNQGVEFTLNTSPIRKQNFSWDFGFNVAYNTIEITNIFESTDPNFKGIPTSSVNDTKVGRHFVGYSPYVFYVSKQVYDPSTGKPIEGLYEDLNRDGVVDDKDVYFYKKPAADFTFGINTQFAYKKFSLGLAAHGSIGNYLYNQYDATSGLLRNVQNPLNFIGNVSKNYLESGFSNARYSSDYYIQNASFFRLDNINLGYNVGSILKNKASLRISGSVQNVFVVTKYKGLDPENSSSEGLDNNIYPRPRIISLGASIDF